MTLTFWFPRHFMLKKLYLAINHSQEASFYKGLVILKTPKQISMLTIDLLSKFRKKIF